MKNRIRRVIFQASSGSKHVSYNSFRFCCVYFEVFLYWVDKGVKISVTQETAAGRQPKNKWLLISEPNSEFDNFISALKLVSTLPLIGILLTFSLSSALASLPLYLAVLDNVSIPWRLFPWWATVTVWEILWESSLIEMTHTLSQNCLVRHQIDNLK